MRSLTALAAALSLAMSACQNYPRDPHATLERAQGGTLRIGVLSNPPWSWLDQSAAGQGVEAELLKGLARELGARIEWVPGTQQDLVDSLKEFQLDAVIGGFRDKNPYKKEVGMTDPYQVSEVLLGFPATIPPPPQKIEGTVVGVRPHSEAERLARKKGAETLPLEEPLRHKGMVAAEDWELEQWDFRKTELKLDKEKRVILTSPGENAWLVRLERYLKERKDRIKSLILDEAKEAQQAGRAAR